jgi:hypothetical protein
VAGSDLRAEPPIGVLVLPAALVSTVPVGSAYAAPQPAGLPAVATPAAATLPEVTMTCAAGQTDINSATAPQLIDAFALDPPVAAV